MNDNYDNDVISNLKFISNLQVGEKVLVKYKSIQTTGFVTSLSRTFWYRCNRQNLKNFVENTIITAMKVCWSAKGNPCSSKRSVHLNILRELVRVKKGLKNIKLTYIEDLLLVCEISTLEENIDDFLRIHDYSEEVEHIDVEYTEVEDVQVEEEEENKREKKIGNFLNKPSIKLK